MSRSTITDASALIEQLQTGVVVHRADTSVSYANPKALELMRITLEQALGKDAYDPQWKFLDRLGRPMRREQYPVSLVQQSGQSIDNVEVGITDSSCDSVTWVLCSAYPEFCSEDSSKLQAIVVTFSDITRSKKTIPFEDIVARANDAVVVTEAASVDGDGPKIVYVNAAASDLTGYAPEEMIGHTPRMMQGPGTSRRELDRIRDALVEQSAVRSQLLNYRKDGMPYWIDMALAPLRNDFGEVTFFAAIQRDITEAKQREFDLQELSIRDPLTGLHNRRGFMELAEPAAALAHRGRALATIAALDIDHFKVINDEHGHGVGDRALKVLGTIFEDHLRSSDVIGRMGGEEFAILLINTDLDSALQKMEALRERVERTLVPLGKDEHAGSIQMTTSIGLAPLELAGRDFSARDVLEAGLATADAALYRAKLSGRNRVIVSADKRR